MSLPSPTLTGSCEHLSSLLQQLLCCTRAWEHWPWERRSTGTQLGLQAHCCQSCPKGADLLQPQVVQLAEETSCFSLLPLPSLEFSGYQATAPLLLLCCLLSPEEV